MDYKAEYERQKRVINSFTNFFKHAQHLVTENGESALVRFVTYTIPLSALFLAPRTSKKSLFVVACLDNPFLFIYGLDKQRTINKMKRKLVKFYAKDKSLDGIEIPDYLPEDF